MPKVLFVTTSFEPGAIPNILSDLAPYWRHLGWEPTVLTLEASPENRAAVDRWTSLGCDFEALNLAPTATLGALGPLGRAIRRIGPDLIHTHLGRADVYTPWVKGKVPQISTFHSVRRNAGRSTQLGWQLSDRQVAHRTGVSQACIDSFYHDRFLRSPHSVVYNPVNPNRLVPGRSRVEVLTALGWPADVRLLLAVGRLVPVKGHAELLEAFAALAPDRPDLRLTLVGDGPLQASLEAQIATLGLKDRVRLVGASAAVGDFYAAADLLVFPSHWEGLGLVPLEALVCHCPVASSRLPAVAEFLTEGVTGRFFKPQNPTDLVRVVGELLDDPQGARAMTARGGALVRERFSPERIAREYADLYRNVLGG